VLRLWPKQIYVGLFDNIGWIGPRAGNQTLYETIRHGDAATPGQQLDAMLTTLERPFAQRSKLIVGLSVRNTLCIAMPWNDALRSDVERNAYAKAHFNQVGLDVGEEHVIYADYREYGGTGFAYAVSRSVLGEICTVAAKHRMEIVNAMPLAAIAYCAPRRRQELWRVLLEDGAVSLLTFSRDCVRTFDVEPIFGGATPALRRLLTRVSDCAGEPAMVEVWRACVGGDGVEDVIKSFAAKATMRSLTPNDLRKFQ